MTVQNRHTFGLHPGPRRELHPVLLPRRPDYRLAHMSTHSTEEHYEI
jgi:hypothetical protein